MITINEKEYEVTKAEIKVCKFLLDMNEGYDINIHIEFGKNGYLNISAGFGKNSDINNFINREYIGVPYQSEYGQINFFEIYDTETFLDTEITNELDLKIGSYLERKIEATIVLNDDLIKINYLGNLDVVS